MENREGKMKMKFSKNTPGQEMKWFTNQDQLQYHTTP
jgi:hypothetical protein